MKIAKRELLVELLEQAWRAIHFSRWMRPSCRRWPRKKFWKYVDHLVDTAPRCPHVGDELLRERPVVVPAALILVILDQLALDSPRR